MSDRVQFTCNGEQVEVSSGPGESLLSVLREQLGIISVKDGCAPQGQCGCCTVLVDGDPRVACVTPATRVAGRAVTTVEGLDPAVGGDARRRVRRHRRIAVRVLHARDRRARRRACGPRERAGRSTSIGRSPRTCAGAPAGRPCTTRSSGGSVGRGRGTRSRRRGAAGRARGRSAAGGGRGSAARRRGLRRRPCAPRRAGRGAVPSAADRSADAVDAAGTSWVVAESLLEARVRAGQGAGPAHDAEARPPLDLPSASAGRRAARDGLGRARLPRARRVVVRAGWRARVTARQRRRVRRQGRLARERGGACARRPLRSRGARRVLARRRRAARAEAAADRRQSRATTTAGRRSPERSSARWIRSWRRSSGRTASTK